MNREVWSDIRLLYREAFHYHWWTLMAVLAGTLIGAWLR